MTHPCPDCNALCESITIPGTITHRQVENLPSEPDNATVYMVTHFYECKCGHKFRNETREATIVY